MGKARKLKLIRKAATLLPAMQTTAFVKEKVSGEELIKQGVVETKDGKKISDKENYVRRSAVPIAVNHNRQMKAIFNKHGMAGAAAYAREVEKRVALAKEVEKRAKQLDPKEV